MPLTSLVVPRLGTTNDGGGTTSPAEAKIIVGGPCTVVHVVGGEATQAALTLMRISISVCPRAAVEWSAAGQFLEGSLGELILAVTHGSL